MPRAKLIAEASSSMKVACPPSGLWPAVRLMLSNAVSTDAPTTMFWLVVMSVVAKAAAATNATPKVLA